MWTVLCPVWTDNGSEEPQFDANVLRCGQRYTVGRKDADININRQWISRTQGSFVVGSYTENDVFDMSKNPPLEYINSSGKDCTLIRDGNENPIIIPAGGTSLLRHGDNLMLHTKQGKNFVRCLWDAVVCFIQDMQTISARDCVAIGMKLCLEYDPHITLHIAEQITGEPNQIPVLLRGGSIVTRQWVTKLFEMSTSLDPKSNKPLLKFKQPSVKDCLPEFSPNLKQSFCQSGLWEENSGRIDMFKMHRFLFLIEGNMLPTTWRDVMDAGSAAYDTFDVHNGVIRWTTHLMHARANEMDRTSELVVITDEGAMEAAVGDVWKDYIRETQRIGLRFLPYDSILEAVLLTDVSSLRTRFDPGDVASQLPDEVPGSLADEASSIDLTQQRRSVTRRLPTRRSPSVAIVSGLGSQNSREEEEAPARSKLLRRRVRQGSAEATGANSQVPAINDRPSSPATHSVDNRIGTVVSRAKLRRRDPTQGTQTPEPEPFVESILDKHRKLFEETDPDRRPGPRSQHQEMRDASQAGGSLVDLVEQADQDRLRKLETNMSNSRKRKAPEVIEESTSAISIVQADTGGARSRATSRARSMAPPSKKRVVSHAEPGALEIVHEESEATPNAIAPKPKASQKAKLSMTQPDQDEIFLKALASMKKGKKKEDQFDRDFNSLKIVKPVVDRIDELDVDLETWDHLPKDMDIRGDFFICVETIVPRQDAQAQKRKEGRPEWVGRPDFKKFKKKVHAKRSAIVDLVANLSLDGFEDVHAKDDLNIDHDSGIRGKARPLRSQAVAFSEDEGTQEVEGYSGRAKSNGRTARAKPQPLFIPDSDDGEANGNKSAEESDEDMSTRVKSKSAEATKRKAHVLAASSSDEEGYRVRRKRRK